MAKQIQPKDSPFVKQPAVPDIKVPVETDQPKDSPFVKQPAVPDIKVPVETDQPKAAMPTAGNNNVERIMREIRTVRIEVPMCVNPPDRGYSTPPYIALHFTQSRTKAGRSVIHSLHWALKEIGAKLANGRPVRDRNDAIVWLIDQIGSQEQSNGKG